MAVPFMIGPEQHELILAALKQAKQNPISLETIQKVAMKEPKEFVTMEDRSPEIEELVEKHVNVLLPFGYRLAITVEEQPPGPCLHLSLSSELIKGRTPVPEALQMCAEACGASGEPLMVWLEEYEVDEEGTISIAINGVWLMPQ